MEFPRPVRLKPAHPVLLLVLLLYVAGALLLWRTPFFWDSVSILSRPATFLYENRFSDFSFPRQMVSDNTPLSVALAGWWCVFGRNLPATHVFFMLFGIGVIWQVFRLCEKSSPSPRATPFIFLLAVSDTALATQLLVPMFDSVLLFVFLLTLRSILDRRKRATVVYACLLAMLRSRGIMLCGILGILHVLVGQRTATGKETWRNLLDFVPAAAVSVFLLLFQIRHQDQVFGIGKDSPWTLAGAERMLGNTASFARFMLEYGKAFLWGTLVFLFFRYGKSRFRTASCDNLAVSCGLLLAFSLLVSIPFKNPFGPRYFLPFFVLFPLWTGQVTFSLLPFKRARLLCLLLAAMLWSGHFRHYPDTTAKSWDTTLAHVPYYSLRKDLSAYLEENGIENSEIRACFPLEKPDYWTFLEGSKTEFSTMPHAPYALYGNLCNLPDPASAGIDSTYVLLKRFEKGRVYLEIHERKEHAAARKKDYATACGFGSSSERL